MDYYCIKDALTEGVLLKVRFNCDAGHECIQEIIKGRKVEDKMVYLPYYMVECLIGTEYIQVEGLVTREEELEIEGAPEHCNLEQTMFYNTVIKTAEAQLIQPEQKEAIKAMHMKRVLVGSQRLGDATEAYLDREEQDILRRGRVGWSSGL
ncbi:hypothetical protein NEDG_00825 [Nematocida displodere]|uniref:Uncharacterized protein n=1 Tax=Nematocida displodere TaxID=1805483 RepID=A0A177EEY0_9MICR|nr:hypothetical protein NEDG_00825 [Nematocida displodere]